MTIIDSYGCMLQSLEEVMGTGTGLSLMVFATGVNTVVITATG